jgi:hypothetical protein
MSRRTLLAAAVALTAAALGAAPAHADDLVCTNGDQWPLYGTTVCVDLNSATSGTQYIPYSIQRDCVGSVCTPSQSGTIPVPRVNGQVVRAHGTLCVNMLCVPFDTAIVGGTIVFPDLPPLQ